ncbi:MAG: hypothetical protein COU22_02995 [Candidatus Komeilibacteria bacterium CG10_big_fil_rev_8_21_14_0_10_41_13]|uniref:CxxC-x17-CxxC domain-containing protein n=1 Tax=Candidatus Komeilibacteria bacterium CG10_big_fil_rev_8_21_14_0_10_41_13 TaxID=1974476 RepID=A0A2M6WBY0_9BACT|nr:MAG: hypothetical protein COU22_02995 [Candidatus Komeilibacteria bacterium CG10_big_fil_rev_8_21_14_0_10_41_13]
MGNFRQGGRSGGRGRSFGGRRSDRPSMHRAVCSQCGEACEVPFKPTGSKPVYCSDCFGSSGHSESRSFNRRDRRSEEKTMYKAVCDQCGEACEVPFKPSGDKPIYCSDCFAQGEGRDNRSKGGSGKGDSKQLEMINQKLDKILQALSLKDIEEPTVKKEAVKKDKEVAKPEKAVKKETKTKKIKVEKKKSAVKPKKKK